MVTPVLEVKDLTVTTSVGQALLDRVGFQLAPGGRLGLIGASGSGKSMTAAALCGVLRPPLQVQSGQVLLNGRDIMALDAKAWRAVRGQSVFQIFQSPGTALSPGLRIARQLEEAARQAGRDSLAPVGQALEAVRLPEDVLRTYPYQLSGGMKQRVLIAMALILRPKVLIADEPTTGLDVLTERDVLKALKVMLDETGAALLYISHDLRAVRQVAADSLILSKGQVVETLALDQMDRAVSQEGQALAAAARELEFGSTVLDRPGRMRGAPC